MATMPKATRRELRKKGFKLESMTPVSLRFPAELWKRAGWEAQSQGLDRAEFVRSVLTRATRDTKPPKSQESRTVDVSPETWARWCAVATGIFAVPIDVFIAKVVEHHVRKAEREQPNE